MCTPSFGQFFASHSPEIAAVFQQVDLLQCLENCARNHETVGKGLEDASGWVVGVQDGVVPELEWLDAPPAEGLQRAVTLLQSLGALDSDGRITPEGMVVLHFHHKTGIKCRCLHVLPPVFIGLLCVLHVYLA